MHNSIGNVLYEINNCLHIHTNKKQFHNKYIYIFLCVGIMALNIAAKMLFDSEDSNNHPNSAIITPNKGCFPFGKNSL